MNVFELMSPAMAIAAAIASGIGELMSSGSVQLPEVRTYVGKLHIAIGMTIKTLPPP